MGSKSGAGAATSSGVDYQARVGGYVIVTTICGTDNDLTNSGKVETIGFETTECVDDINLILSDRSAIYIQAKAVINFSLSDGGELRSVFRQFCAQEYRIPDEGGKFILATSGRSSNKIVCDLRTALNAYHSTPEHNFFRDQPEPLTAIILELRHTIEELQIEAGRPKDANIVDRIIRKSSVFNLDIEAGSSLEQAIILLLKSQGFAEPSAVWGKIISDCVGHSKARHTLKIANVKASYDQYRIDESESAPETENDPIKLDLGTMDFSTGKEVVLCRIEEDTPAFPAGLAIFELYRFDHDCSQRIVFSEDTVTITEGVHFPLVRRAATVSGLRRFLDANPEIVHGEKVTICPINSDDSFDVGLCAETHLERLRTAIRNNSCLFHCLHCGQAVWEKEPILIEMEPVEKPAVGLSHKRCLAPADRLLGIAVSDAFSTYPELVNFDANKWFQASHNGQAVFKNIEFHGLNRIATIAWDGRDPTLPFGAYVVQIFLQEGEYQIVTQRNSVHRFSKTEAEELVLSLNNTFEEARQQSDPFCYTDQSKGFGKYSQLVELFGGQERIVPVDRARVRKYEERLVAHFNKLGQWYTPVFYLRSVDSGEPLTAHHVVLLLTDPLQLRNFLENWKEARIAVPDYEIEIIASDLEFDEFMRWVERRGWGVVANAVFNQRDGSLVSGLPIGSLESLSATQA